METMNLVMKYKQFQDSEEITLNPLVGFSDVSILDEELDYGSFDFISNNPEPLMIMGYVIYTITQGDNEIKRNFIVGSDDVVEINKKEGSKKYRHTVFLVEMTKLLEKSLAEVITFTQPIKTNTVMLSYSYTLFDCLLRILKICPLRKASDIGDLTLDTTNGYWKITLSGQTFKFPFSLHSKTFSRTDPKTWTGALDVLAPQMVLDTGTLKDKLNSIIKYINGVIRLTDYNTFSIDLFNAITDYEFTNELTSININKNIEEYSTELITFGSNIINESSADISSIYEPTATSYKLVGTDSYSLNDSNYQAMTQYPIYTVQELEFEDNLFTYSIGRVGTQNQIPIKPNLTSRIVEEEQYQGLDSSILSSNYTYSFSSLLILKSNKNQNNTLYYKYKDNKITLSDAKKSVLFDNSILSNTIAFSIAETLWQKTIDDGKAQESYYIFTKLTDSDYQQLAIMHITSSGLSLNVTPILSSAFPYQKLYYKINYVPLIDNQIMKTNKYIYRDGNENIKQATTLENQETRLVSLDYYYRNLQGRVQRLGNNNINLSVVNKTLDNMLSLGTMLSSDEFNGEYKVIKIENIYYPYHIITNYELSKNYNRINDFIGINAEWRGWQAPSGNSIYERQTHYSQYCVISKVNDFQEQTNDCWLKDFTFLNQLKEDYDKPSISSCIYSVDDTQLKDTWYNLGYGTYANTSKVLELPIVSAGGGNTLSFALSFNDSISAGSIYGKEEGSKKLMVKIPYCKSYGDDIGKLTKFQLSLNTQSNATEEIDYHNSPLFKSLNVDEDLEVIKTPYLQVEKDASEILSFTYFLHFIPKDNLVVGSKFTSENALVTDYKNKPLYVYYSNYIYNQLDNKCDRSGVRFRANTIEDGQSLVNINFSTAYKNRASIGVEYKQDENGNNYSTWAIGDEFGNLYLASNDMQPIFLTFHDKLPNVKINE